MPIYSNAADVLPPDLLREVQMHWRGLLYVPPAANPAQEEDADFIRTMIRSGCPAVEVAAIAGVTLGRVYQIARLLGAENPYLRNGRRRNSGKHINSTRREFRPSAMARGEKSGPRKSHNSTVPPSELKSYGARKGSEG